MNTEDKSFMSTFLLVLGILVIFTVVVFMAANLLSTASTNATKNTDAYKEQQAKQIQERIGKIGSVETFDPSAKPEVRTGKGIYEAVCTTCHATGVLSAPKVGTAGDWTARMAGGFDALVTSSTVGKGAMPPKGGDTSLTDMEMKKVVAYMLKESGLDAPDLSAEGGEAAAAPTAEATPAAATTETAPAAETNTTAATATVVETVADAGSSAASTVAATATAATAAVTNMASGAMQAVTGTAPEQAAAPAPKAAGNFDAGKKVYKTACFACHDSGVAGAPKLGDKAAWAPRLATGLDAMIDSALNGKGAMPPKGGRIDLTTEDIKASVEFMVSEAE